MATKKIASLVLGATYSLANPSFAADNQGSADPNLNVLGTVVIQGKTAQEKVGDAVREIAPDSQTTLSKEQLEKFVGLDGAVTGALRYTPGVHFGGGDNSGITEGKFTIRGFSQDQIGVTRDGVPVNDPQYGTPHTDFFGESENYESISVLYGSASNGAPALTASGGTIQIRTVAPTDEAGVLVKQSIGSSDLKKTFARINFGLHDGFSAWMSASRSTAELWTNDKGNLESDRYEANLQKRWGNGNRINLILSSFAMNTNSYYTPTLAAYRSQPYETGYPLVGYPTLGGSNGVADVLIPGTSAGGQRADFKIQTYGINGVFNIADDVQLRVNPYYVRVADGTASIFNFPLSEALINKDISGDGDKLDTRPVVATLLPTQYRIGVSTSVDWALNQQNTVQAGVWQDYIHATHQIQFQPADGNGRPAALDGSEPITDGNGNVVYLANKFNTLKTYKFWLQDTWTNLDAWTVAGSLAWQHTNLESRKGRELFSAAGYDRSQTYTRLLPSVKVSYALDPINQIFYSATSNWKVPLVESLYPAPGSARQEPEEAFNQEIGWRYSTPDILLSSALFLNSFRNRQATTTVSGVSTYINAGDLTTKGIELAINGKFAQRFNYFGSWTYTSAKQDDDYSAPNVTVATSGRQLFNTPKYLASAGIGYDDGTDYANFLGRYTSSFYGDLANLEKIDAYTIFDANYGHRLKLGNHSAKLSLNLYNLFDKKYLSGVSTGVVSAALTTPTYYKGAPRSVVATLSVDF